MKRKQLLHAAVVAALAVMAPIVPVHAQTSFDFRSWAPDPPMGWNSWDCYYSSVNEQQVLQNAHYLVDNDLVKYGWKYVVVDIRWYCNHPSLGGGNYNQRGTQGYVLDDYGRYLPSPTRFPSAMQNGVNKGFTALADSLHRMGLKLGIHIMRGIPKIAVNQKTPVKGTDGITADQVYNEDRLCRWLHDNYSVDASKPGAQEYYNSIFELYASWGVDFIKIDDLSSPYHKEEIEMIRKAIDGCGRPIVLSTSPGATPPSEAAHISTHANMWRMVNDVWDLWRDVTNLMRVAEDWYPYIQTGTWPDCDMIPLGRLSIRGERGEDRPSRLTKDEQRSLMTFFCILRSPLMFGGDMPSLDEFTTSLLTNREVLRMHSQSRDVRQVFRTEDRLAVTSVDAVTGETYLALFNMAEEDQHVEVSLADLGLKGRKKLTDLWTGEHSRSGKDSICAVLQPHASVLYRIR